MRTIEIDFDIHKAIEMERRGFDEAPNAALRRLLKLPAAHEQERAAADSDGGGWVGDGVRLPNGTLLRMSYSRRTHEGVIDRNAWLVEGRIFKSPSDAASGVARTRQGKRTRLNGWAYWEVVLPGTKEWLRLAELRGTPTIANGFLDV